MPGLTTPTGNTPLTEGPDPRREPRRGALPEGGRPAKSTRAVPMREIGRERQHLPCALGHQAGGHGPP